MKMEAVEKAEFSSQDGLEETEASSKGIDTKSGDTCKEDDGSFPKETTAKLTKENSEHSLKISGLSVEPCLLMELGQDSSESQLPSADSDKQTAGRTYDSDSSNQCMVSPSSSGHLADSDTLSSVEENEAPQTNVAVEEDPSGGSGPSIGRKSRRSRSESETSTMAPKKNRSSNDKQNGRVSKVRTQKQKERIRLLRQKREAAARKKYTLLQDSSTSDSDLTCDSSTSSSEDEVSGNGNRTISAEIPAANTRAEGSAGTSAQMAGLLDSGISWERNCIGNVLEEAMNCFAEMQRQTEERFRMWMEKLTRLDTDEDAKQQPNRQEPKMSTSGTPVPPSNQSGTFMHLSSNHSNPQPSHNLYMNNQPNIDCTPAYQMSFNNNPSTGFQENGNSSGHDLNHSNV
ncbi:protein ARK2N isoform X2 [Hemitrygon akajei]|uniref:protein ARK2N isoform X2 n=1 Tax=Hemitrygon akajei TaxID=2704970 RepID=UPI003BF99EA4